MAGSAASRASGVAELGWGFAGRSAKAVPIVTPTPAALARSARSFATLPTRGRELTVTVHATSLPPLDGEGSAAWSLCDLAKLGWGEATNTRH